jgi:hypothetical protein
MLQIYEGKVEPWVMSENCTDNVPVLIRRATFCSAFAADARDFRSYNSWVSQITPCCLHSVSCNPNFCLLLFLYRNKRHCLAHAHKSWPHARTG